MTCMETQRLITPFINDELTLNQTEEFIDHVNSCPECREELEVYYALLTAMKQLDEDKILYDDFSMELSTKLEREQEKIIQTKFTYYRKKGMLVLIILMMAFVMNWRYSGSKLEPRIIVTESNYQLRYQYRRYRKEPIEVSLQNYMRKTSDQR
ncbi:MAG: zf-HC2 domain-containing protein [Clostridiales bacterium]|jgi:hypothetical protein|nr:zf-HC2 domain-containing protein [Clostridiales bacterium]